MVQRFIPLVSIVFTILFTSIYPYYTGASINTVTNEYAFRASPSNWAFSIWGVIFTWLICIAIYNASMVSESILHPVWGSLCFVMPCFWILAFVHREIELACVALFLCLITAIMTFFFLDVDTDVIVTNGIALYVGWLCSATLLNIFIVVQFYYGGAHDVIDILFVTILACTHVVFIALAPVETLRRGIAFTVVGVWTSIAVATEYYERRMIATPIVLFCILLVGSYRIFMKT